ncbi:MAG: carboxypeptidase-like regulatory domain-containing protein [Gemmatimonadota bacterium]|nr:carboxypeptidase-like regulatory domain-containing protein [Gemmatimonadota bacterium]
MSRRSVKFSPLLLGLALAFPSPVGGQSVSGSVLERDSGAPLPGTFVVLVDSTGTDRNRGLTTQAGTFRLGVPAAGTYRLRVERIGIVDVTTEPFSVDDGQAVSQVVRVSRSPIRLDELEVEAEPQCTMLEEDAVILLGVWEEVRKALEATYWTGQQTYYRFDALLSRRELDRHGNAESEPELESIRLYGRHPFRSARADDLAFGGWVRPTGAGGVKFHAPDAEVLLSESFRRRHCYRLRRESIDGREYIGVEFEPLPSRRLPDISGVLWIDVVTSELRSLDFRYEVLDLPFETEKLGGQVEFDRLPDGAWIVRRWVIRTPIARPVSSRSFSGRRRGADMRLVGLYEEGQRVTAVWRTGDLQASPDSELPAGIPPVNAPSDVLVRRYPDSD